MDRDVSNESQSSETPAEVDLDAAIKANAVAPSSASNDRESASQHPLKDQLAVARHFDRKAIEAANGNNGRGRRVRFTKVIPPGAVE